MLRIRARVPNPHRQGYVEFGDLQSLTHSLSLDGAEWADRKVRVSVANPSKAPGAGRPGAFGSSAPRTQRDEQFASFGSSRPPRQEGPRSGAPYEEKPVDDGKERPKLQLAPRTVAAAPATPAEPRAAAASKPSPFGNAKPVDTAAALKRKEEERKKAEAAKPTPQPAAQ